jgi:aspartyl-tRNA synthetase
MNTNLRLRHSIVKTIRRFLEDELNFVEVCMGTSGIMKKCKLHE